MTKPDTGHQMAIAGEVTPERFAKLTAHLRVNGKPVENILHRLEVEKRGEARPDRIPAP